MLGNSLFNFKERLAILLSKIDYLVEVITALNQIIYK